jgi:ParB family chromosome partitioning protein
MVAYRLVELVGRASAANILGITVRQLDKLVQVFELSQRIENLRDPTAAITWARELMGVNKALLTPSVVDAVVRKVGRQQITNSKDLRKLRVILRDPVARAHFVEDDATIDSSLLRVAGQDKQSGGLISQLDATMKTIRSVPWTELEELKGDPRVVKRVAEAEALLRSLRLNLST